MQAYRCPWLQEGDANGIGAAFAFDLRNVEEFGDNGFTRRREALFVGDH